MRTLTGIRALSAVLLSTACIASAQTTGARLSGTVADQTGAVIPKANISVVNTGTGLQQTAVSDDSGGYTLLALPPGTYRLTVNKDGFAPRQQDGIALTVGQQGTLNLALSPGSSGQTVTVTGGADIINATSPEISQVVGEASVKQLPLNGRDPSSLVVLTTGVTNELQSQASTLPTTNSFPTESGASAGGGRQGSTYYLLDGVTNMDYFALLAAPFPNADATQEFRVISNNFDARYGFSPGAVVSIQTKGGSNQFHGGAFEFLRNNDLNAANYFSHAVDPLKRNQFGGYVGGPIIKDKLFFFANYQGTRASLASTANPVYTPTAAMLRGDFSAVPIALNGPFTTIGGKSNQVNPALFSPGALKITASLPAGGDAATGLTNFQGPAQRYTYNEGTARLDYAFSPKQRVFARSFTYTFNQPGTSVPGNILAGVQGLRGVYLNEAVNHTWTISPSLLNSVTAYYQSLDYGAGTQVLDTTGAPVCLSRFISVSDPAGSCYIGGLNVFNGNSLYGGGQGFAAFAGAPVDTKRRNWGATETLTKIAGNHTLYFGTDILYRYSTERSSNPANANVSITGQYTGFELSDFLLGNMSSFSQGGGESGSVRGWMIGVYAQDQYKLRRNVTLTAGLRWDPFTPFAITNGRGSAFVAGQQSTRYPNAPVGLVFPGDKGIDNAIMPTSYLYFEPRLGIAWQPRPKTAVRAGFGLFTTPIEDAFYNHVWDIQPFSPTFSFNGTQTVPLNFDHPYAGFKGGNPFPPFSSPGFVPAGTAPFTTPVALGAVFAQNFRLGVTQSWNLSVEQQFTSSLAMHLAYVASESYHQATTVDLNPGIYANGGVRTLHPNFQQIIQVQIGATANYQSLQAGLEKRFSQGFQIQSNVTWSKTFDVGGSGDPSFESSVSDPFDVGHDRGPSSLNYPVVWVSNGLWELPKLTNRNVITRSTLGGWALSGIYTLQSGPPFTVNGGSGNNNSGFQVGQDRADLTGQPFGVRQGGKQNWLNHYFNPAAFQENAPGTPGNSPKFLLQEAPISTMDLGIQKNWTVRERYGFQFRWEMFNALNHPSFGQPDSNPSDSNFGQITSVGAIPPRVMQGAVKLTF